MIILLLLYHQDQRVIKINFFYVIVCICPGMYYFASVHAQINKSYALQKETYWQENVYVIASSQSHLLPPPTKYLLF